MGIKPSYVRPIVTSRYVIDRWNFPFRFMLIDRSAGVRSSCPSPCDPPIGLAWANVSAWLRIA